MCVILYKPKNQEMPSQEIIESCFTRNPDGAGYMIPLNNQVIIHKGFNSSKDLLTDLNKLASDNNVDLKSLPLIIHFRISTQGGVKKALCHPYPLTNDYAHMRELKSTCDIGVAHNGIISLTSRYYALNSKLDYNDTMTFIKDYLSLIISNDLYFNKRFNKMQLIKNLIGSNNKLAIMNKEGYVTLINDFYKVDGIYYSNLNHFNKGGLFNVNNII